MTVFGDFNLSNKSVKSTHCRTLFGLQSKVPAARWEGWLYKSSHRRCSIKKVFLKISQNSQENTCSRVFFLIKLRASNFIKKETLAQVLSCEFCEIFKNIFFREHLRVTASGFTVTLHQYLLNIYQVFTKFKNSSTFEPLNGESFLFKKLLTFCF